MRKKYKIRTLKHLCWCVHCNTEFKAKSTKAKYCSSKCKNKVNIKREQIPVYQHTARLKRFNLTPELFQSLQERSKGACEICGTQTNRLAIDHNHTTTQVRGMLCMACNTGLGLFSDSISKLEKAIDYLKHDNVS